MPWSSIDVVVFDIALHLMPTRCLRGESSYEEPSLDEDSRRRIAY
jgi:hypothetical protein